MNYDLEYVLYQGPVTKSETIGMACDAQPDSLKIELKMHVSKLLPQQYTLEQLNIQYLLYGMLLVV